MADEQGMSQDEFLVKFMGITNCDHTEATDYGNRHTWDLDTALAAFYENIESGDMEVDAVGAPEPAPTTTQGTQESSAASAYTGPRTLSGAPAPEYQRPVKNKPAKKKGVATLDSMGGSSSHQHDHDDDDDDDDDDDGRGDLYAGGEKSGLSVQDPRAAQGASSKKIIEDILAKARQNDPHDHHDEEQAGPSRSHFRGSGQKLGNESEAPASTESASSQQPTDATAEPADNPAEPPQERTLHLWQNGFSIDDGELRRFDDPENARELQMIQHGRAPLHLMNLRLDQAVNVVVKQHKEEYSQPARVYRSFAGEGRRLGSPVPGASSDTRAASIAETVATSAPAASSNTAAMTSNVDESQPTLTIRIQLPDGTRLPARFNSTHTIGDVYNFVLRASPGTAGSTWVLATTFPNKDHDDRSLILGEMPEFKRGGTAIVKVPKV